MKKYSISIFILILVISTGLGGCSMCSNNTQKYTKEEVKQQMLDYIENKYDMEFKVADIWYQTWGRDWEEMRAYPKGGDPEDTFDIYRYTKDNGDVYYVDNYLIFAKRDEYKKYIESFADEYFTEYGCKISFSWSVGEKNDLTQNISFSEFKEYADENLYLTIYLYVNEESESTAESCFEALCKELSQNIPQGHLYVFGFSDYYYQSDIKSAESDSEYNSENSVFKLEQRWDNDNQ